MAGVTTETTPPDVLGELTWRGLIAQTTDLAALRQSLAGGPVTLYGGFDPTAPSLHIGNLVLLITLRHLQRAGHRVLCLVGGSTGLIGDPKPTAERNLNSPELVAGWVLRLQHQIRPCLEFGGDNPATMVNNLDWTAGLSALDFLRDIGKHFRVNVMIKKDAVAARLAGQDGISYTEFSYQVLQGLDYLHLHREYGCTLQLGGADQWGNILAGTDLIHRAEQVAVHAMTTPLITKADGTKFGKTEDGTVWLDRDLTSPYAFYQLWINVEDGSVIDYLKVFTGLGRAEIDALAEATAAEPYRRAAQKTLAVEVTTLVHGAAACAAVQQASEALFGKGDLHSLDGQTLLDATAELPGAEAEVGSSVIELLCATGLARSRSEARRSIEEGAVTLNQRRIADLEHRLVAEDFLHGSVAVLRRGRKAQAAARLAGAARGRISSAAG
ncbi:MAG: tyrosine--tRNA ligase [Jatrophihabitans sp.]